jgi:hypothetical protein
VTSKICSEGGNRTRDATISAERLPPADTGDRPRQSKCGVAERLTFQYWITVGALFISRSSSSKAARRYRGTPRLRCPAAFVDIHLRSPQVVQDFFPSAQIAPAGDLVVCRANRIRSIQQQEYSGPLNPRGWQFDSLDAGPLIPGWKKPVEAASYSVPAASERFVVSDGSSVSTLCRRDLAFSVRYQPWRGPNSTASIPITTLPRECMRARSW